MKKLTDLFEQHSPRSIFFGLILIYFLLYIVHIPQYTANADVLVYSCRAMNETPITQYAYLDQRSNILSDEAAVPNIHIAHTILLWLIYKLSPAYVYAGIYPSGILSALFGAFAVGLVFLVNMKLQFDKMTAIYISIVAGFVPSIFYHSMIGEVYALGLFSVLLFIYLFQSRKNIASAFSFTLANLVSPTYGSTFLFYYLTERNVTTLIRTISIGSISLILYIVIQKYLIDVDIYQIFSGNKDYFHQDYYNVRAAIIYMYYFVFNILVNINILLYFMMKGFLELWKDHRNLFFGIILILLSQFIITFPNHIFISEYGSFFLPLFWVLCIPIGVGLKKTKYSFLYLFLSLIVVYCVTQALWLKPNYELGEARHIAGTQLRTVSKQDIKIMGEWTTSIGIVIGLYGWDYEKLASHYIHCVNPTDAHLIKSGEREMFVVEPKVPEWKRYLMELIPFIKFRSVEKKYEFRSNEGKSEIVYEDNELIIHHWKKYLNTD